MLREAVLRMYAYNQEMTERLLDACSPVHGTQHRSEAALMLTALGRSPGDLDLL